MPYSTLTIFICYPFAPGPVRHISWSPIVQILNTPLGTWLMDAKWSEAAADVLRCLEGLHGHDHYVNSALISAVLSL